jgi:hypothetical protein
MHGGHFADTAMLLAKPSESSRRFDQQFLSPYCF